MGTPKWSGVPVAMPAWQPPAGAEDPHAEFCAEMKQFLALDLQHLFDEVGIDSSKYDDNVVSYSSASRVVFPTILAGQFREILGQVSLEGSRGLPLKSWQSHTRTSSAASSCYLILYYSFYHGRYSFIHSFLHSFLHSFSTIIN